MFLKLLSVFLALTVVYGYGGAIFCRSEEVNYKNFKHDKTYFESLNAEENSYQWFIKNEAYPDDSGEPLTLGSQYAEKTANALVWKFTAQLSARYYIKIRYSPNEDAFGEMEYRLTVNGKTPYNELSNFVLPREYVDAGDPVIDIYGNEIRAEQVAARRTTENFVFDYTGSFSEPLSINLKRGENTLVLENISGQARIESIQLIPAGNISSYADYAKKYADTAVYNGDNITVEAEKTAYKSDPTLYAVGDKSSPLVSPVERGKIRLNTVGGYRWSTANQYIAWKINVPKSGLYSLSFKVRQNVTLGQKSSRILFVNGEIPFREAAAIAIPFSTEWQYVTPGDENGPYLFYLKEGENEIRLQATLGDMDETIRILDGCVETLNGIYRKLLVIIGSNPDKARDYKLDKLVPNQLEEMRRQAQILAECADFIEKFYGGRNAGIGLLRTIHRQLIEFSDDSDKVAQNFSYFKTNIGALGTWISSAKQQPLSIDFIVICGQKADLPPANAGFLKQLVFNASEFLTSFVTDYRRIGELETSKTDTSIKVWISSGRDQAQVIRNMISDSFSPSRGIRVQLELVAAGSLLPATVAGTGPDVNIGGADIVNFAMRNAAYDLTGFEDFGEISKRFNDTMFIPLRYMNGIYGLPESLSFPVLFYRQDILEEIGVKVPETWDDVMAMSSVLAKNNMEFGLPAGNASFLMMIKQNNLDIYENDGMSCALNQVEAIHVFEKYTNLYVNYGLPLSYDFVNRFRSGEMPVAVAEFNFYNNLQVAAPEIKGLWDFALVPGTRLPDGTVNHTTLVSGSAAMLLKNSGRHEAGWEFLKWWTSAETQSRYAREIESVLGPSGRYTSANLEALARSSWPKENLELLKKQMSEVSAIEQVPGGYFLSRHLDNAFRNVVYKKKSPMDMLYDYVYKIDQELTEKRREFNLPGSVKIT